MIVFNIYIFNRAGTCLYYYEWSRTKKPENAADDYKTMFGLLWTMKMFTGAIDPVASEKLGQDMHIGKGCSFYSFRTNNFKTHFLESPSGLKFVLNTDSSAGDLRDALKHIYNGIFLEFVVKNPLYTPGAKVECELFTNALHKYIEQLSITVR